MTMNSGASLLAHHSMIAEVEPIKSAIASTDSGHSGCATTLALGYAARASATRRAGNVACTMQVPCQIFMFCRPVCFLTQLPRLLSGKNSTGFSAGIELTICTALRDVHRISLSAFTSIEVLM